MIPLLLLGLEGPVVAQDRPPAPKRMSDAVQDHVRRARIARDAGRWTEAEAAYRGALDAADANAMTEAQRAEMVGELGLCELSLRKYRDAAEHLAESLSRRALLGPALQRRFEEGQRRAEAFVARLYVGVTPPDAEVRVDGNLIAKHVPAHELFLEPGRHTVRARMDGYEPAVHTFTVAAREQRMVELQLPVLPRAAERVHEAKPVIAPAAPSDGGSTGSTLRTVGVLATGATALAGATFLILGAVNDANLEARQADLRADGWGWDTCTRADAPAWCTELRGAEERRDVFDRLGYSAFAISGAVGAVTLASFLMGRAEAEKRARVRVVPVPMDQHAAIMAYGYW